MKVFKKLKRKYREWRYGCVYMTGKEICEALPEYAEKHNLTDEQEYEVY